MTASQGWSKELEGLRGIASLWVLLGHISLLVNFHIKLISSPGIGVDLFILLSGYLMAKNYIERKDREPWNKAETIRKFWIRRFFRIAPLYYTLLVFAICFGPWLGEMRDIISQYSPVLLLKRRDIQISPCLIFLLTSPSYSASYLNTGLTPPFPTGALAWRCSSICCSPSLC